MADTIKVTLSPNTLDATPEVPVELTVAIYNTGPTVEEYTLTLDGLPPACYALPDERIALFPNDHDEARITIRFGPGMGLDAGVTPFTVTVAARANPAERATVQGTVRVATVGALDAQLRPSRAIGRRARFKVLLRNQGNATVDVDLDAYDSEEGCDFSFEPLVTHLRPGQKETVSMQVRPLHTRLVGPQHVYDFQVAVEPSLGAARPLHGQFIYKPRFRSWRPFSRIVSLLAALTLLAAIAPTVLPRIFSNPRIVNAEPNAAIGNVTLGTTNPAAVERALGKGATMTNHDSVVTQPQQGGSITARLHKGQVVALETTSPAVKLPGDIHVGSPISTVKKAFGPALAVVGGAAAAAQASAGGADSTPTAPSAGHSSPTAGSGLPGNTPVGGSAPAANALGGGALVVVGKNTVDGQHPQMYFNLDKAGTHVTAIRMGVFPWITPDHGSATRISAITTTTTWTLAGGPYLIAAPVRIPSGVSLTIRPGVYVYFTTKDASLYVDGGALHAIGTPDAPVVFTALNDQQHGAFDTLNRPAPNKADWGGLGVTGAGGTLDLNNTEVYYGSSAPGAGNAEVYVDGGGQPVVSVQNSTIEAASGYGLNAGAAPPDTIIHGDVFNADNYPLLINGGMSLDDSNLFAPQGEVHNTHDAVFVRRNATIAAAGATVTWAQHRVPFVLKGDETIGPAGTLQIGPDVILKGYDAASGLTVRDGILLVAGQEHHPVLMTSYRDDAQGGDSNGDGTASRPKRGDWQGIAATGTGRVTAYRLKIWWAGSNGRPALSIDDHVAASITRSEIAEGAGDGLTIGSDQALALTTTSIHDNVGYGLAFGNAVALSATALSRNKITQNGQGAFSLGGRPLVVPSPGASPTVPPSTPAASTATATVSSTPTLTPTVTNSPSPTSTTGSTPTASPGSATPATSASPPVTTTATSSPSVTVAPAAEVTAVQASGGTPTTTPSATP